MKTMRKTSVVAWFQSQGMPQAAAQFSELFDWAKDVDHTDIKEFLHIIYSTGDDEYIFLKMQCDIPTSLHMELDIQD